MSVKLLFVCLGNICRSPTAEGVMRTLAERAGMTDEIEIDSAATGTWHIGQAPDIRAQRACKVHGVDISGHRARRVKREDFEVFDKILACDEFNLHDLQRMSPPEYRSKIELLMPYAGNPNDRVVPDPYEGDLQAFEETFRRCEAACKGLLAAVGKPA